MAIKLGELTCAGIARSVASGDLSASELIDSTLDAITAQDDNLGAFLRLRQTSPTAGPAN